MIVKRHPTPFFGTRKLDSIDVEAIERYVGERRRKGLGPRTLNRHLNLLNLILGAAVKRSLARTNPVSLVDRPREPRRRWRILSPAEVVAVERALDKMIAQAEAEEEREERAWLQQSRVMFLVLVSAGFRRGELLGLRWRHVYLADPDGPHLRVAETWVRGGVDTPKSEAGRGRWRSGSG